MKTYHIIRYVASGDPVYASLYTYCGKCVEPTRAGRIGLKVDITGDAEDELCSDCVAKLRLAEADKAEDD